MRIIQQVRAPEILVDLIETEFKFNTAVKQVIICGDTDQFDGLGVFVAETGSIILKLGECITNNRWMDLGMNFVACVWTNLIYTVYHEKAHTLQYLNGDYDPDDREWEDLRLRLEDDADRYAIENAIDWFSAHKTVPPITRMGWLGNRLQEMFNSVYPRAQKFVAKELDTWGAGMTLDMAAQRPELAGDVEILENVSDGYKNLSEAGRLLDGIHKGQVGAMVKDEPCLSIGESLELLFGENR